MWNGTLKTITSFLPIIIFGIAIICHSLKHHSQVVHLVFKFSVMLVKPFQVPENKIWLPNLVHLAYRIVFTPVLQNDIRNPWISKLMTLLPFWEKLLMKAVIHGTRFNNWGPQCPSWPWTEQPHCPSHSPAHSPDSHWHCLYVREQWHCLFS